MIYKVKHLLKFLNFSRKMTTDMLLYTGFMFVLVLALTSYVYLSGQPLGDAGKLDLAAAVTKWGGKIGYVFIGVIILFLISKASPYVLRFRNWWVHTENHKVELRKPESWLGVIRRRYELK